MLTGAQFALCPALNEPPDQTVQQLAYWITDIPAYNAFYHNNTDQQITVTTNLHKFYQGT